MNIDPQPQNGGCLWLLLIPLAFMIGFFGLTVPMVGTVELKLEFAPPTPAPEPAVFSPYVIETAGISISGSQPARVTIEVSGYAPDGCDLPANVEVNRDGSTVVVTVYRMLSPAMICPAVIVPFERTIELGTFEPGRYTVIINNSLTLSFSI